MHCASRCHHRQRKEWTRLSAHGLLQPSVVNGFAKHCGGRSLSATIALVTMTCFASSATSGCAWVVKGWPDTTSRHESKVLPAPPAPEPEPVQVPHMPAPSEGEGVVVIAVDDPEVSVQLIGAKSTMVVEAPGQTQVVGVRNPDGSVSVVVGQERVSMVGVGVESRLLCARTPCAVALPAGAATLKFNRSATDEGRLTGDEYRVDVNPSQPQLVTHTMSQSRSEVLQQRREASGELADILLETAGWSALLIALAFASGGGDEGPGAAPIWGLGLGGAAMIGLGVVLYDPGAPGRTLDVRAPSATSLTPYPP